ncbi:hypothetical protein Plim_3546 [Planctopirus limnophila DSM 3776]|uniref:Uncharacterized protein n=1 Tax=Planctopirus limnophila (strain ATCC 43296 / DSM 3776 / IFAM 1008 / Mu 290) TaxID=521674 RepID=D5SV73_PLAL2|nr:hypothetical protein Plim_3546 [Planctopirus limnophila DSM 3776]
MVEGEKERRGEGKEGGKEKKGSGRVSSSSGGHQETDHTDVNKQLRGGWLGLSLRTPSDFRHELGVREDAQPQPPHTNERS